MNDFMFQGSVQNAKLSSMLIYSQYQNVRDEISGKIFQEKNFSKDWDSIYVHPSELDNGMSKKGMRKITTPTLVMASHSSKMAFVLASEDEPVFVCSGFMRTKTIGYTLLFELNPGILPDYLFYLSKYESWVGISKRIDTEDKYKDIYGDLGTSGWKNVGEVFADGVITDYTTAENVFKNGVYESSINIPSIPVQKQRIADAIAMEKMLQEKMAEKERKFQQKEWLNEAHIRNSKHRLSHEVMPMRMAIERLQSFFLKHSEGVKLSDIIGEKTKQSVNDLLEGLLYSVGNIETEIENLTKSEQPGEPEQILNVVSSLNDYFDRIASKYPASFNIERIGFEKDLNIKISPKAFMELLDNIVGNAVRHGFIGNRKDYLLQVAIEATDDNMCEIAIANNGEPMSERARATFFEQGSFAGPTGHTGIGGHRIYDICDKAGGEAMPPYSKEGFPVVICVKFPLV